MILFTQKLTPHDRFPDNQTLFIQLADSTSMIINVNALNTDSLAYPIVSHQLNTLHILPCSNYLTTCY